MYIVTQSLTSLCVVDAAYIYNNDIHMRYTCIEITRLTDGVFNCVLSYCDWLDLSMECCPV